MSKLLRYFAPGQYCFITTVTANRLPILDQHAHLLDRAVQKAREKSRFAVTAWVVLPDHIHAVLHTPQGDTSRIVQQVKLSFSLQYQRLSGRSDSIWQHRYWDHIIRSEEDMRRHLDYIHYNPVKHGFTDSPAKWVLSSFQRYLQSGLYGPDWGQKPIEFGEETFGE